MKTKFPRALAIEVARELVQALSPACEPERVIVAGSLRRGRAEVGDVEILYIAKTEMRPVVGDLFAQNRVDLADLVIRDLMSRQILKLREGENGHTAYGPKNKLLVHVYTGVPVDLFASTEASWWNYLVCRTGPKESNMAIAAAAQAKGWAWKPYGAGFAGKGSEFHTVTSEREVFEFVGLPFKEPKDR